MTMQPRAIAPRPGVALARIDVLSLGGTIAMTRDSEDGVVPHLSAADLVRAVPGLAALADVHATSVRTVPGASLSFGDLVETVRVGRERVREGARGIVVTQGTDSLEETAYALDLLWDLPEPIVVTGAMRPPEAAGADGPGNLWTATAVAAAPAARGRGCLVAFGDEVHRARDVAKVHASRPAGFASPGCGPAGLVYEGVPRFDAPPSARPAALRPRAGEPPEVALVPVVLGDAGIQLRATAAAQVDGVVLAAMGAGHVPERLLPALEEAVARMPVAATSRTGAGRLLRRTYAFPGSERDLQRLGLLDAGDLSGLKARVLLTLALWSEEERGAAEAAFRAHAEHDRGAPA